MLNFGRDYTRSVAETRRIEKGSRTVELNGDTLLGWPDYQRGQVAVVFSTLFAVPVRRLLPGEEWDTQVYADFEQAHRVYHAQMLAYQRFAADHPDKFRLIRSVPDLDEVLAHWQKPVSQEEGHPVGMVALMEGAEGIRTPAELDEWWALGLRIIGLAWAGTRYCGGTREPGPLTDDGRALLAAMSDFGFSLDLSHMDEAAALQSLDFYPGAIIAGHANAAALLPGVESNRHLSDRLIQGIIARDGVIGVVPYNLFIKPGWKKGDSRAGILLEHLVPHIDHICQLAGDARHVGVGSDFDGGLGLPSVPEDVDTIADLQKLAALLSARGYSDADVASIFGGNWLDHLRKSLPKS